MLTRRKFIAGGAALVAAPVALAQQCRVTPRDALGPFYVKGAPAQADLCASGTGGAQKLTVSGRVLGTPECAPLAGALVKVWQADARGDYTQVTAGKKDDPGCLLRASLTEKNGNVARFLSISARRLMGERIRNPRLLGERERRRRLSGYGCRMARRICRYAHPLRRTQMPKGQQRSNREPKKPKQHKKPAVPATRFIATQARTSAPTPVPAPVPDKKP